MDKYVKTVSKDFLTLKKIRGGRKSQGGWALAEVLGAFALVLIAMGGVYILFQMAFASNRIGDAMNEMSTTKSNIGRLFSQQSTYAGLNNEIAVKAGLVPGNMVVDDTGGDESITNAFGGFVIIEPDDGDGAGKPGATTATDSHYKITSSRIPQDACVQLGNYKSTEWNGGVSINGSYVEPDDVAAATAACNDTDNENEIVFVGR